MPPLEAWEKVYIKLPSSGLIGDVDVHLATLTCTECHGGDAAEQDDYERAHVGLVLDPSAVAVGSCARCHREIANTAQHSMHQQLWGEKNAMAARAGVETFEQCPETLRQGFLGECASCHATCGDCHISRPDGVGKGFIKSHQFSKTPHQKNQCMACHGSRVAFDFMGDDETGRKPDVHFAKGWNCMRCHDGNQLHADSRGVPDRYHVPQAPRCERCHADVEDTNAYHLVHWDDMSCHVCHAQPYNNCTACHVNNEWQQDPIYAEQSPTLDFRIGLNPLPSRRYKYVTLRHAPVATTSFDPWGAAGTLLGYDSLPTWKYATPHSIRRWTERTEVPAGASCGTSCHLGGPDGSMDNADYYLWDAYIQQNWPDEYIANLPVVVDDALPAAWQ